MAYHEFYDSCLSFRTRFSTKRSNSISFIATRMNTPRWFVVYLQQDGKLKRLPRMIIVDTLALTVHGFETQLSSLCR